MFPYHIHVYHSGSKNTPETIAVIVLKDADGLAKSVGPDQTAPLGIQTVSLVCNVCCLCCIEFVSDYQTFTHL